MRLLSILPFLFSFSVLASENKTFIEFPAYTDQRQLVSKFSPELQDFAHKIIRNNYEREARSIANNTVALGKYGLTYPLHSEVLYSLIDESRKKTVLEIAGAAGENSILLALGGAQAVYLNDIEEAEIKNFEHNQKGLPRPVRDKLHAIQGDFFDLLKLKPDFVEKFDIIYCRNFFHFLKDTEHAKFFDVMDKLLKKDGKVILCVNSLDPYNKEIMKNDPFVTRFQLTRGLIYENDPRYTNKMAVRARKITFSVVNPCLEDKDPLAYQKENVYAIAGYHGKCDRPALDRLPLSIQTTFLKTLGENKALLESIQKGSYQILVNNQRAFHPEALKKIFQAHNYEPLQTFTVNLVNGHLTSLDNAIRGDLFVQGGIIARKKTLQ